MALSHIQTIIDKEWAEVFKNRIVLFTVGLLPLIFTALPLVMLYATRQGAVGGDTADVPPQFLALCEGLSASECLQVFLVSQFLLLFMLMPLIIPIAIAAYSVVGEKTTRSLEPLLATPITTVELLLGKSLAAVIPAVLATWAGFAVFVIAAPLAAGSAAVRAGILTPVWLMAVTVAGPLMAVMAVNFAVIVSSRVSDPRVAEQISAVIILPLLGLMFGQLAGVIVLNLRLMFIAVGALLAADAGLTFLGVRLFQRETILTRWK